MAETGDNSGQQLDESISRSKNSSASDLVKAVQTRIRKVTPSLTGFHVLETGNHGLVINDGTTEGSGICIDIAEGHQEILQRATELQIQGIGNPAFEKAEDQVICKMRS